MTFIGSYKDDSTLIAKSFFFSSTSVRLGIGFFDFSFSRNIRKVNVVSKKISDNWCTTPDTYWPLGRVIAVETDRAGLVKVATIKTQSSEYVSPIHKLLYLPISDQVCAVYHSFNITSWVTYWLGKLVSCTRVSIQVPFFKKRFMFMFMFMFIVFLMLIVCFKDDFFLHLLYP